MEVTVVLFCLLEVMEQVEAKTEPGVIESLVLAANSRPWLWSIYVFTVGLPVILFISFMWPDKRFGPPDQPYYYKKSDEVQEDDPESSPLTEAAAGDHRRTEERESVGAERPGPMAGTPLCSDKTTETVARRREALKTQKKSDLDLKVD